MDILCDGVSSVNPTANSFIQINNERRFYRNVYGAGEINISHLCNLTVNSDNLTNLSCESNTSPPCCPSQKNWPALLTVIVIVLTIAGNILVIMAVSLEKKLQNATNYFLMSLAIADMLLGFLVMPVSMLTILYGYEWPLPRKLCAIWIYLDVLFSTASIMHLCAISLDRYIAIRNPIHHSRFNSRTKAFAKIIAVWTISVGISMPIPVFGLQDDSKVFKKDIFKKDICLLADENFVLVGSFVAFFIPLTIMVVTYFLTIKSLQKEAMLCVNDIGPKTKFASFSFLPQSSLSSEKLFQRSLNRDTGTSGRRTMQSISNEQKASKVLGIVFFLFVVMWCPFFITNVMAVICKESCKEEVIGGLLNIFVWIGYLSSAVNPLVYTLFNKTYRSAFARYIQCRYKEEKKPFQLILVNTIPALAYDSSQLQLAQMKSLKKEAKMMAKDYSTVMIGTQRLDGPSKGSIGPGNEKVSGV
ncbi:5-hydroxytryptamine receptor 2A [Taeniopygia guttata]|uniref:5-hydroxytryptamine receptor 2A n=1 Tax=Taeniopygia guttata TaxID=59729 RepID=UPI003BB880C4